MIYTKEIVKDKFWIMENSGVKIGTIRCCSSDDFELNIKQSDLSDAILNEHMSLSELTSHFGEKILHPKERPVKIIDENSYVLKSLDRNTLVNIQTPQFFKSEVLYKNIDLISNSNFDLTNITDDSSFLNPSSYKIKVLKGDEKNIKITTQNDVNNTQSIFYGIGFDVHKLVPRKKLYLGGIKIPSSVGTLGHSDGDPVLHAIIDALLGACNMGDIGEKFSDKNKKFKNIRSTILLKKVVEEIKSKEFIINNIDINIITQKPKLQKYKKKMVNCIKKLCEISNSQINIKGKTTEKLGVIGKEKAIAC